MYPPTPLVVFKYIYTIEYGSFEYGWSILTYNFLFSILYQCFIVWLFCLLCAFVLPNIILSTVVCSIRSQHCFTRQKHLFTFAFYIILNSSDDTMFSSILNFIASDNFTPSTLIFPLLCVPKLQCASTTTATT